MCLSCFQMLSNCLFPGLLQSTIHTCCHQTILINSHHLDPSNRSVSTLLPTPNHCLRLSVKHSINQTGFINVCVCVISSTHETNKKIIKNCNKKTLSSTEIMRSMSDGQFGGWERIYGGKRIYRGKDTHFNAVDCPFKHLVDKPICKVGRSGARGQF